MLHKKRTKVSNPFISLDPACAHMRSLSPTQISGVCTYIRHVASEVKHHPRRREVISRQADNANLSDAVLLQSVLKWLHHPLAKYVMLVHAASFWHDCLHRSRLACCPDDCPRYFSPPAKLHAVFEPPTDLQESAQVMCVYVHTGRRKVWRRQGCVNCENMQLHHCLR